MDGEGQSLRCRLLRDALERRISEVNVILGDQTDDDGDQDTHLSSQHDEEALRLVMVRLWPRLAAGTISSEERVRLYRFLNDLRDAARSTDLRFLDAWNNVYETVRDGGETRFLRNYVRLLEAHVLRIAER